MDTNIKTLIALMGIIVGVLVSEKSVYCSEVAGISFLLGVLQISIYFFERRKILKSLTQNEEKINNEVTRFSIPLASGIFFIAIFLIVFRMQFSVEKEHLVCEKSCSFNAVITNTPTIKNEYQLFSVRPETEGVVYDVQIKAPLYPRFQVGEKLELVGKVSLPYIAMPHAGKKTFDYEMYLRTRGIGSEMVYPKVVVLTGSGAGYSFKIKLQQLRETFVRNISLYVSEPAASLASGMLFGVTSMSEELTQTFRTAGISHIIVLSGFNIVILISFVLLVLVFLPLFVRVLCAGVFVIFFVLMVGGEASIVRATIMSFIGLVALLIGRAYVARQALIVSLIMIIVYEPIHLFHDVSLHLSFLATAGIVYMSEGIKSTLHKIRFKTYQEIIATTVSAYLATLPYVMYTFGTVSLYALLANFIVLPVVPVMMLLTFFVVLISPFAHTPTLVVGYVDTLLGNVIIFVAHMIERLPLASLTVSVSFTSMCVGYCILIGGYIFFTQRHVRKVKNETLLTKQNEILSEVISY